MCYTVTMRVRDLVVMLTALLSSIFAVVGAFGQSQSVTSSADVFPFSVRGSNYVYSSRYQSLRDIDFRNSPIHLPQESKDVLLINSHYEQKSEVDPEAVDLNEVHYLSAPSSTGAEYALLLLQRKVGDKQQAIAQVLEFTNQRLRLVQQVEKDFSYAGPHFAYSFNESSLTLLLHASTSAFTFQWNGRDFAEAALITSRGVVTIRK
jgi:hypothetical protein